MENLFLTVVNMSITATWVVMAFTVLRPLLKKMPKWVSCFLWGIVAVRLCLPFSFESVYSLIPTAQTIPRNITTSSSPQIDSGVPVVNDVVNPVISGSFTPDPSYSVNPLQVVVSVASYIWIIGLILMVLYCVISYIMLKRKVSASVHYNNNIYYCDNIETPFILGVIKPEIYIPSGVNESDLQFILEHEKSHIKRKDYLIKPLSFLLLSVYWFNPAIWLWYILFCRDIESACDEKAIKFYDNEYKKLYSTALLNCSTQKRIIMACPVAFGETGVKQRIKSVLNYKKPAFCVVGFAMILTVWLTIFFVSNPENNKLNDILNENGYKIIGSKEKVMSFEFMSSVIKPEMSEEGFYNIKSKPVAVNDFLEIEFTELLSHDDRYTLTFKADYPALPDEGTVFVVNANQFDGGLELGEEIIVSDPFGKVENGSTYIATCSSQGPGTEFSFSIPKIWFEDRQDNKIVIELEMLEINYIKTASKDKTESYIYSNEKTGDFHRIKDNFYYAVIDKTLEYHEIGLYFSEPDSDKRYICNLGGAFDSSVIFDETVYYISDDKKIYTFELSENAEPKLFAENIYYPEIPVYLINDIEAVSDEYLFCLAERHGLSGLAPSFIYLKISRETGEYSEIDGSEVPVINPLFAECLSDIESATNAELENIFVQKMDLKFKENGSFDSGIITIQFYDKAESDFPRIGNVLLTEDLTVLFNEYEEFEEVYSVNTDNLACIEKVLKKVDVVEDSSFFENNIEKGYESFYLLYLGKAILNDYEREEPYTIYYDSLDFVLKDTYRVKHFMQSGYRFQEVGKSGELSENNAVINGEEFFVLTPYYDSKVAPYVAFEDETGVAGGLSVIYFDELTEKSDWNYNTFNTNDYESKKVTEANLGEVTVQVPTSAYVDYFTPNGQRITEVVGE